MKSLAFQVVEGNMGAQYHHYLLGIILQNEEGKKFVFNNYMSMLVKHFYERYFRPVDHSWTIGAFS